jgi:hypothetical protein
MIKKVLIIAVLAFCFYAFFIMQDFKVMNLLLFVPLVFLAERLWKGKKLF